MNSLKLVAEVSASFGVPTDILDLLTPSNRKAIERLAAYTPESVDLSVPSFYFSVESSV
jgi:predicted transcriptional regulator